MPRYTIRIPKYRLHKASGQAVVTLNGHDVYLGKHGTPDSKARYNQLVAEWQLNGQTAPAKYQSSERTIDELILAYMEHVRQYYVKNGRPTGSQEEARRSLLPLHETYGTVPCTEFGPLALKAMRQSLIDRGWSRPTINKAASIIKRLFKWAAENELASAEVFHRLQTVGGLRRGCSAAR